ncbi:hypothetical protein MOMUL_17560 [Moorella mulderi DSM 14980]|uniref:Uncharacterized protein n=3 Tax=Neomoorellaceae TaxID=3039168 RepID=A0A151AX24_9FIRM|nr:MULTISPECIES: hypothetical protein [Moorella]KYH32181.1 hypothetical protein MOMUL_17560 [Moorella mulderi DSM 14980]QGP93271.1 hypothetical protein MGLY_26780 [Moorella glycerini]
MARLGLGMMKVVITAHARKRLQDLRQEQINEHDIRVAARSIPGHIPTATRFRGFMAASGRPFDLVVKDVLAGRLVITIIGK